MFRGIILILFVFPLSLYAGEYPFAGIWVSYDLDKNLSKDDLSKECVDEFYLSSSDGVVRKYEFSRERAEEYFLSNSGSDIYDNTWSAVCEFFLGIEICETNGEVNKAKYEKLDEDTWGACALNEEGEINTMECWKTSRCDIEMFPNVSLRSSVSGLLLDPK